MSATKTILIKLAGCLVGKYLDKMTLEVLFSKFLTIVTYKCIRLKNTGFGGLSKFGHKLNVYI